jgi:hypothetical protein
MYVDENTFFQLLLSPSPPRYSRKGRLAGDLPLSGAGSAGSPPFLAASLLLEMTGICGSGRWCIYSLLPV